MFPYLGSLVTEDGHDGIPYQVKKEQAIGTSLQKTWRSHSIPISTKIRLVKAAVQHDFTLSISCIGTTVATHSPAEL